MVGPEQEGERVSTLLTREVDDILVVYVVDKSLVDISRIDNLVAELNNLVLDGFPKKVVINLQNVRFMSSMMFGKLIQFGKKCQAAKVNLRICGANPDLKKAFELMSLHKEFAIDDTEAQSLAALK